MEPPPPSPASATTAAVTSPRPPVVPSMLRLMCSYGGHIVPRPLDKSLFYASGETRIVAVDRRTTSSLLSAFSAHLSRTLFNNRPFHLKYQLPSEDLDSLISVITDEDLSNMLEEHDRIAPPARIRLFLFPLKLDSIGSAKLDPKSETWFSDALKSTGILQKGQSADSVLLMGIGSDLEAPVESGSNGGGGEGKLGAESLVLETSSSFGSTSSSFSVSNSPPIGVNQCDEKNLNLLDRKIRVPSSASIESEISVASLSVQPKPGILQEPLIQVDLEESSENHVSDPSLNITTHNPVQVLGYPLSQPPDGKKQQLETQLIQGGGLHYIPQCPGPVPISPYYHPLYQMQMHPQNISCPSNQPYPIYLVPVRPSQYPNMSYNSLDANTTNSSIQAPLHPQAALITQSVVAQKEVLVSIPSIQGQVVVGQGQVVVGPPEPEPQVGSEPITTVSVGSEFDEDIVYNQIYKTQPLPPLVPTMTKGTTMLVEPPSVQVQQKKLC